MIDVYNGVASIIGLSPVLCESMLMTIKSKNLTPRSGTKVQLQPLLNDPARREMWKTMINDPEIPKLMDLFCGAGGMSAGFVDAGFAVSLAIDHDQDALNTFAANIPAHAICSDVSEIDPGHLLHEMGIEAPDVIVGGPPCQGFSIAGRSRIRSLEDSVQTPLLARNELYADFFRFVEAFEPSFYVLENVPGLLSFADGAYIQAIEAESTRLGYRPEIGVLDAVDYGVPQFRRRLFVIGARWDCVFRWPRKAPKQDRVKLVDAIGDLPVTKPPSYEEERHYSLPDNPGLYQRLMRSRVAMDERNLVYDHIVRPVREDDRTIFMNMRPGDRYTDVPSELRRYDATKFKDKYYMLKPDEPGNTITAHLAKDGYRYIHWDPEQHRTISVREAARIQSFGDHFRFAGSRTARFRMIGNAVPPILAQELAAQLNRAIRRTSWKATALFRD